MLYFYDTSITSVTMIVLDCKILIIMYSISGTISNITFVYIFCIFYLCSKTHQKHQSFFDYSSTFLSNQQFLWYVIVAFYEHQHFNICV